MAYNAVAADAETAKKVVPSVFVHKHTCASCGAVTESEIAPEHLFHPALASIHHSAPAPKWHAVHSQSIAYTWNVLLVVIVIFLTFFAARYLFKGP